MTSISTRRNSTAHKNLSQLESIWVHVLRKFWILNFRRLPRVPIGRAFSASALQKQLFVLRFIRVFSSIYFIPSARTDSGALALSAYCRQIGMSREYVHPMLMMQICTMCLCTQHTPHSRRNKMVSDARRRVKVNKGRHHRRRCRRAPYHHPHRRRWISLGKMRQRKINLTHCREILWRFRRHQTKMKSIVCLINKNIGCPFVRCAWIFRVNAKTTDGFIQTATTKWTELNHYLLLFSLSLVSILMAGLFLLHFSLVAIWNNVAARLQRQHRQPKGLVLRPTRNYPKLVRTHTHSTRWKDGTMATMTVARNNKRLCPNLDVFIFPNETANNTPERRAYHTLRSDRRRSALR